MIENLEKRDGEELYDYKVRLYQGATTDSWKDIGVILNKQHNPDHIRKTAYGYIECYKDMTQNTYDRNILFLNDIHLPFERKEVIETVKKHAHEITSLFIGGDLLDCYDCSKFPHDNHLPITQELIYGYEWLKEVRKILGDKPIYMIKGNHEARWTKVILKDTMLQNFINPNILEMYVDGFKLFVDGKKKVFEPIENLHYINSWYASIDNKIVYCHPSDFSQVDGKMCEKVAEHFINKEIPFEVVIFGHTHKFSSMTVSRRKGVYTVENGCLCKSMNYADSGKLGYTPQHTCYSLVKYNMNEPINYNNIKTYHLEPETMYSDDNLIIT